MILQKNETKFGFIFDLYLTINQEKYSTISSICSITADEEIYKLAVSTPITT